LESEDVRINTSTISKNDPQMVQTGRRKAFNSHAFRHSGTSHMLVENGADIRVIQKLLGHALIMTTEIYTQVAIRRTRTHGRDYIQS
jgi:site-specific recombinase XerD